MQKKLLLKRKELRINSTPFESEMWNQLRNRQVNNCKFRRQQSIGIYIADFYCAAEKLVIEIDGDSHFASIEALEYDRRRTLFFNSLEIRVLRFTNNDVRDSLEDVIRIIAEKIIS